MTEKIEYSLPKTGFLKGSLHLENKRCGKPNCRCQRGFRHGPYYYLHWRDRGRQRKAYVSRKKVADVLSAIARRQALEREIEAIRKQLRRSIEA